MIMYDMYRKCLKIKIRGIEVFIRILFNTLKVLALKSGFDLL